VNNYQLQGINLIVHLFDNFKVVGLLSSLGAPFNSVTINMDRFLTTIALLFRHNLKDNVRISLYDACNHWMKSMAKQGTKFMGGETPDLSDLAVYGVLSSIEGCITFQDVLQHTSIGTWYYSMKENVQSHAGCSAMNG
jgi:hypothetical protein